MNPETMQRLIESDSRLEDWLHDRNLSDELRAVLAGEIHAAYFKVQIFLPADDPTLTEVANSLTAVERRLRLCLILAFLEPVQIARYEDIDSLLTEFRWLPLKVVQLSLSTVKLTVEGKPDEVSAVVGGGKPPRKWPKILLAAALFFGAGGITNGNTSGATNQPPGYEEGLTIADRICGRLGEGTTIKINIGPIELETTCSEALSQERSGTPMTIEELQRRLLELGYNPGPLDGKRGPLTTTALLNFQMDNKLPVTGELDEQTIDALRNAEASV